MDGAEEAGHSPQSQDHPSYHEEIRFACGNPSPQEMAADGAASPQVRESAQQKVSCRQT